MRLTRTSYYWNWYKGDVENLGGLGGGDHREVAKIAKIDGGEGAGDITKGAETRRHGEEDGPQIFTDYKD